MKIYTGGGDKGRTSLFSGERVAKDHRRVEAGGDVDELNSMLGLLAARLTEAEADLKVELERAQARLFDVGAFISTDPRAPQLAALSGLGEAEVRGLEANIDRLEAELPPLTGFILPGGDPEAALAHLARTVCRRAERRVVGLVAGLDDKEGRYLEGPVAYLNRLSDYLFVLARYLNLVRGRADVAWQGPTG